MVPKLGPFLCLVISTLIDGSFVGIGGNHLPLMSEGLGRIFSQLAVIVFCGAILAEYLRKTGALEKVVSDLLELSKKVLVVSGLAGYLISLTVMCSITAYMILEPLVSYLGQKTGESPTESYFL
ncbi:MAG: hypothetical protein MUO26_09140 [Methanotrichaceae archaeon]|nr:hypothetical protein [Methanotrichaceae archaeon]